MASIPQLNAGSVLSYSATFFTHKTPQLMSTPNITFLWVFRLRSLMKDIGNNARAKSLAALMTVRVSLLMRLSTLAADLHWRRRFLQSFWDLDNDRVSKESTTSSLAGTDQRHIRRMEPKQQSRSRSLRTETTASPYPCFCRRSEVARSKWLSCWQPGLTGTEVSQGKSISKFRSCHDRISRIYVDHSPPVRRVWWNRFEQ